MENFLKKEGKKSWNIFHKDNKSEVKKPSQGTSEKKAEKLRILVIYGISSEGVELSRQRKNWAKVTFVISVRCELAKKKQSREPLYFTGDDLP